MNTLSWLIYLANVVGNLREVLAVLAFLGGFVGGIGLLFLWGLNFAEETGYRPIRPTIAWASLVSVVLALSIITPSASTIYLIAASEAGEQVTSSPEALEIMGDIKAVINKRLKDELSD